MNVTEGSASDTTEDMSHTTSLAASDSELCLNENKVSDARRKETKSSSNGSLRRDGGKQLKRHRSLGSSRDFASASNESLSSRSQHQLRRTSLSNLGSGTRPRPIQTPRETKASIRRKQLAHCSGQSREDGDAYLTPWQRKDETIRELRRALKEGQETLRRKDKEIQMILSEKDTELTRLLADKDDEIHSLRGRLRELEQDSAQLREEQDRLKDDRDCLKLKNKQLELELKERVEREQDMYLLMYQKGKRSADFERQDTLEELASQDPKSVPMSELLAKLEQMQERLSELQNTTRITQYQDGVLLSPRTDSEAKLRVIKDALFHYLTSEGQVAKTKNLNILLGLAAFTEVQRRKIEVALSKSKTQKKAC